MSIIYWKIHQQLPESKMEADNCKFSAGIFPFTNGWLNWHFWSVHHWLIFTIVPIILTTRPSAGPAQIGQEANKLKRDFSNTINFLSSWGFTFSFSFDWLRRTLSQFFSALSWCRFLAFALFSFTLLFFETNASFAKGYILLCFSLWASAVVKDWSMLLWNSAILPKHFSLNRCSCPLMIFPEFLVNRWPHSFWMLLLSFSDFSFKS